MLQHPDSTKLQWTATTKRGRSRIVEHEHRATAEHEYFNIRTLQNYSGAKQQNVDVQKP